MGAHALIQLTLDKRPNRRDRDKASDALSSMARDLSRDPTNSQSSVDHAGDRQEYTAGILQVHQVVAPAPLRYVFDLPRLTSPRPIVLEKAFCEIPEHNLKDQGAKSATRVANVGLREKPHQFRPDANISVSYETRWTLNHQPTTN